MLSGLSICTSHHCLLIQSFLPLYPQDLNLSLWCFPGLEHYGVLSTGLTTSLVYLLLFCLSLCQAMLLIFPFVNTSAALPAFKETMESLGGSERLFTVKPQIPSLFQLCKHFLIPSIGQDHLWLLNEPNSPNSMPLWSKLFCPQPPYSWSKNHLLFEALMETISPKSNDSEFYYS